MGTVSDLVTEITANIDTTPVDALTVLDRRHKLMCARARWCRLSQTLTATTADGDPFSTLDAPDLVEAFEINATSTARGVGGTWRRTQAEDRAAILDGTLRLRGRGGVFVETDETDPTDTTPDVTLMLYPGVTGDVILDGAFRPPTLTTAETAGGFVRVPDEYREGLLAGVYAAILGRPGSDRTDLAAPQEQAFSAACGELRDRADRRYRTRGPKQIRVASR